jgi:regulator of RNase E activity RraA
MSYVRKVPDAMLNAFRDVTVGSVSDAVNKLGFKGNLDSSIGPIFPTKIVGSAITVKEEPCTETVPPIYMIEAVEMAQPGDVICLSSGGDTEVALFGGMASAACKTKGVEAAVIDGGVRDIEENIQNYQFPIFAKSATPATTVGIYKTTSINEPTVVGGVCVNPGDVIIGDRDGVVCVPFALAEQVLAMAREFDEKEAAQTKYILETGSLKKGMLKFNRI